MERKKIIIFSLGGTLLLSHDDVINVWRKTLKRHGLCADEKIIYFDHYGEDFETVILPKMAEKYEWTDAQVDTVVADAKQAFRDINSKVNAGLANKLKALKSQGYSLGILSNRKIAEVESGLEKINCSLELFNFIKTAENGAHKPDPKAFDIMFDSFDPEEMVFVGSDPNKDWPAAKALGIEFVAITIPAIIGLWQTAGIKYIFPNVPAYLDSLLALD
jgi:HAD superfamily hydrolase (TIGR01549 family)